MTSFCEPAAAPDTSEEDAPPDPHVLRQRPQNDAASRPAQLQLGPQQVSAPAQRARPGGPGDSKQRAEPQEGDGGGRLQEGGEAPGSLGSRLQPGVGAGQAQEEAEVRER